MMIARLPRLVIALFAVAGAVVLATATRGLSAADVRPPNILFLFIDNVGYGDLGCYGNTDVRTPHIDRLARDGVRCTQFYIASPSCTPSRGAVLTGRHPERTGLNWQLDSAEQLGLGLPLDEKIIPTYLKPLGYACGAFGKWNIGFGAGGRPTERGFDEFLGHASGNIDFYHHLYDGRLDTYRGTENVRLDGYSTDLFADAAIDFIRRHAERPWFVYLPFNAAHFPQARNTPPGGTTQWQVPAKYMEMYSWQADDPDERRRYLAVLTALDDAIGRVLAVVDDLGMRDNTFVACVSDNGAFMLPGRGLEVASNAPLRDGGVTCYEGGVRVPAVFRWPGRIAPGGVCDAVLSSMDLLPTFVSLAGGATPSDRVLDGVDVTAALSSDHAPQRDLFWVWRDYAAVRSGRWKLVRGKPTAAWELYDLEADISETNDLADKHRHRVSDLEARFERWHTAVKRKP